jgi:DNA-directed RNA polymerase subunit RPC12/RpoP
MKKRQQPDDKIPVVCARCGWRGKRSRTTGWPACPRCGARAELIVPRKDNVQPIKPAFRVN